MAKTNKNNKKKSGGNKLMKKKIFGVIGIIAIVLIIGVGIKYYNEKQYAFWEKNELRITTDFDVVTDDEKAATALNQDIKNEKEADKKVLKKLKDLKAGMNQFFANKYKVDMSKKLDKLKKVYIYSSDDYNGQTLYGYVDNKENKVHLNEKALKDDVLLQSVFTHEVIHYLGIAPVKNTESGMYFIEGLADMLAEECLSFQNKKFQNSPYYEVSMNLWKQIKVVDTNIIKEALTKENYDIMSKFDERLKKIKPTFKKVKSISDTLENSIKTATQYVNSSIRNEEILTIQAQDIVISYIKTFKPSRKQINAIRKHYVLDNYENVEIKKFGDKYLVKL